MAKGSPRRQSPKRNTYSSNYQYDNYNPTSQAYDYGHQRPAHQGAQKRGVSKPTKKQINKTVARPAKPVKSAKPIKVKKRTKAIAKPIVFVKALGAKNQSVAVYTAIVVTFFVSLGYIVAGANVTIQRNTNNQLRNQLRSIEIHNGQIANQIAQARNIEEVEYIARNSLNMSEPMPHQIVAVNIIESRELVVDFTQPHEYEPTFSESAVEFLQRMFVFFTEQ